MKKKFLMFATITLCTTLAGCDKKNNNAENVPSKIWSAYSTENLISDYDYFDGAELNEIYAQRDKTLRFSCMKNENEGAQLMITASSYINSYDFDIPDVTGNNGTIDKSHFSLSAAHYMNIDYSNERNSDSGYYPDALIPFANYKFRRMNYIDKGRTQALYFNLKTDKTTPAGTYKGTGKLHLDDETIEIPFEVKVYDAIMPDEVHQNTAFGIWYDQIIRGEKENANAEMNEAYYNFAISKRISPREMPPEWYDSDNFDVFVNNYVEHVVRNNRVKSIRLPIDVFNFSKSNVETLLQKMITKNIELIEGGENINLFDKCFFYLDDEPYAEQFDLVRMHDKTFFDAKKSLCSQLSAYPEVYESFTRIPNVVTREYLPELVATNTKGGINTWCPLVSYFQTEEERNTYKQRQASTDRDYGEHVWWYTCCDPISPYPNYHLDSKTIIGRIYKYMQYAYDVEAGLFWCINYYAKYSQGNTLDRDIWNDPISWQICAGDGQFVYPGYKFGIKGPITTLRMENLLAANEEYEYLYMIEQKVKEFNEANGTTYNAKELMGKYFERLFTNVIANTDVDNFETVRLELLDVIESLNKNINSGMSKLTR